MHAEGSNGDEYVIRLSTAELTLLNNALNEVCNGVQIDDSEFSTRLGANRQSARDLLAEIGALLPGDSDR